MLIKALNLKYKQVKTQHVYYQRENVTTNTSSI